MKQSIEQQHFQIKQGEHMLLWIIITFMCTYTDDLEQQKVYYERQLAELRDQLQDVGTPVTTTATLRSRNHPFFSPM